MRNLAWGSRSTCSNRVSRLTPSQRVSSLVHLVTQWMSTTKVCEGSLRNSSQVQVTGSDTSPSIVKVQRSSGVRGVGPAESTGKSVTTYWPGGTRLGSAGSSRCRRWKPRENGGLMARGLTSGGASESAGAQALVVEPHQGDHVGDVLVRLDSPSGGADLPPEHRVLDDPPLLPQPRPHVLWGAEVGGPGP